VVEAPCDFGLVRSNDLVGQMVGRKGTTFRNSDFELKAGELTRGMTGKDYDDDLSESVSIGGLRRRLPVAAKIALVTTALTMAVGASPMPPGASAFLIKCVSTSGTSLIRIGR
jgi:hypothetical protein